MTTLEKTPVGSSVDPILAHHCRAIDMVAKSLQPRHRPDVRQTLSRIRWFAAAQDGSLATANDSLAAIEELAEDAEVLLPS
jgi:hypothetical protein